MYKLRPAGETCVSRGGSLAMDSGRGTYGAKFKGKACRLNFNLEIG